LPQAYIVNLCATGNANNGEIIGLDGTAWTSKLGVTAVEGKAIGKTFVIMVTMYGIVL